MNKKAILAIICGGAIIAISMGVRQSFGIFLRPISMDLDIGRQTFGLAMAIQNLLWGALSPFAGYIADRYGAARVTIVSTILYCAGLYLATWARDPLGLHMTLGVLFGLGLSGTTFVTVFGTVSRLVPPEKRSTALGITSAAGSFGMFAVVPGAQSLLESVGWISAMSILAVLSTSMAVFAFGLREDKSSSTAQPQAGAASLGQAFSEAASHSGYWLLFFAFLVCGFHVVFIAIHMPSYLIDKGLAPEVAATALALIGFFNIIGSYAAGRLGDRFAKKYLLAGIYFGRSIAIALFVLTPLTIWSAYAFAAAIGLLWLSTVPLTSGLVGQIFGLRYMSTLYGGVFFSHQIGSFLGAWSGGYVYDLTGSYDIVWWFGVVLGIVAALMHLPIADRPMRPVARPAT